MHQTPRLVDWLYLLALTGFWGTAFLLNELALHSFTPAVIVSGRLAIAALLLLVLLRRSGLTLLKTERNWFSILIMALLGTILPFHLTVWAQQHIDSALTGILIAVTPLFVLSLAHFFMPRERFSAFRVAGFLFGFIGVLCIIGPESIRLMSDSLELWSMFAVLGAALSYAVNSIYTGCIQPGNPTARATHVTILGSVIALPTAVGDFSTITLPPTGMAVIAIIILGLLCTGLASILYFRIVQGAGPTFLSLVNYLIPVWAVIAGALILGESLNARAYAGLALILAGIAISEFGQQVKQIVVRSRERPSTPQEISVVSEKL